LPDYVQARDDDSRELLRARASITNPLNDRKPQRLDSRVRIEHITSQRRSLDLAGSLPYSARIKRSALFLRNRCERTTLKTSFRRTIVDNRPLEICGLWKPKHPLERSHKVATFGSCFAQHVGCALKERGYAWLDAEPPPGIFVPAIQDKYNYGIFSARTGNIYTVAALRQWVSWAIDSATPPEEMWQKKGRFFDPFRPSIEPDGFATPDEMLASRRMVLRAIRNIVVGADWFVFTLGLAEGWVSSSKGYSYAVSPGSIAGEFDCNNHLLKNYTFAEISSDLNWVIEAIHDLNKKVRFLLTVSPISITASTSGRHVSTSSASTKALLRAVAHTTAHNLDMVDYFPSYEIITGAPFQGTLYKAKKHPLPKPGSTVVMDYFFAGVEQAFGDVPAVIELATSAVWSPQNFWSNVLELRNYLRGLN
jgi:GSCFA family